MEHATADLTRTTWRKSSYSDAYGDKCVETTPSLLT